MSNAENRWFVPGNDLGRDSLIGQVFKNRAEAQEVLYSKPPKRRERKQNVENGKGPEAAK
jgi:hypothetical protein